MFQVLADKFLRQLLLWVVEHGGLAWVIKSLPESIPDTYLCVCVCMGGAKGQRSRKAGRLRE